MQKQTVKCSNGPTDHGSTETTIGLGKMDLLPSIFRFDTVFSIHPQCTRMPLLPHFTIT
jgi:hypothetical protein